VCGCFDNCVGNMCTCIYCVLYCVFCVLVLFRLCIFILIWFVCTSENAIAANNNNHNNNNNNNNEKLKVKFGSCTRKTFDRFTTKDSYTWNITHNTESTAV
jgi:hypothetical protein